MTPYLSQERFDELVNQRLYLQKLTRFLIDREKAKIKKNYSSMSEEILELQAMTIASKELEKTGLSTTHHRVRLELDFLTDYLDKEPVA